MINSDNSFELDTITNVLTCVPEKFVVDFANGIGVVDDHLRSRVSQSFFARLKDTFSGNAAARQQSIDQSFQDGMQASLIWLTDLTKSISKSNHAITQVNDRLNVLIANTAHLANFAADTRDQLRALSEHVYLKFSEIDDHLRSIDLSLAGKHQCEYIIAKWKNGDFNSLPIATRCYIALEELKWGNFGDLLRKSESDKAAQLLDILKSEIMDCLRIDANCQIDDRLPASEWLRWSEEQQNPLWADAVNWLGDWTLPEATPVTWSASQRYEQLPLTMPRLCTAGRISTAMISEVFPGVTR